jgi:hypothetical protein
MKSKCDRIIKAVICAGIPFPMILSTMILSFLLRLCHAAYFVV